MDLFVSNQQKHSDADKNRQINIIVISEYN